MKIKTIKSNKILNSGGKWTIETYIELESAHKGIFSVPGGLSKGVNETSSIEPDEAITNIKKIEDKLIGYDFQSQEEFDDLLFQLDGTIDKSNLGGNTILSLSGAFCKASAAFEGLETYKYIDELFHGKNHTHNTNFYMPQMMVLILEGGLHGSSKSSIQEFMAIVDEVEEGIEIYEKVKEELHKLGKSTNVGAEGAFSPEGYDNVQSIELLRKFVGNKQISLDVAASSFADKSVYPNYDEFLLSYPILSIEDPYDENDIESWVTLSDKYRDKLSTKELLIVTDDLTTTNPVLLKDAIEKNAGNAILIKPNQIGSITETLEVIKMAKDNNWATIISHRGTDTNDDFIADLAVGVRADYTKFGAPVRGERVAKYNRLIGI